MKTQMRFQKILMLVTLIVAALTVVYAFSFCTGSITQICKARSGELMGSYRRDPINADALHAYAQDFNGTLVILTVIFVAIVAVLFITSCNSRRNYYITNYVAIGLVVAYALFIAIFMFVGVGGCHALFNNIDFVKFKEIVDGGYLSEYDDSPIMFILGYVLSVIVILDAAVLVLMILLPA